MAVEPLALAVFGFLPRSRTYEEAGHCWEARIIRDRCTLEKRCVKKHFENGDGEGKEEKEDEEVIRVELFDSDGDKYQKYLMKLDSGEWKEQDHYKVLGLSKLRHEASFGEIRIAYRQKVLKHHPDKKKHRGESIPNEEYFVCITKAYEQLGMSEQKRRAYDSVDSAFDDSIPSEKSINKDNFFKLLTHVFERNKRWSTTQPVPGLGDEKTERNEVNRFYNFWFEWSSWREFSYLDEEDKEKGEDRWEKREMEKMNKAERERRRKEEVKRIRKLVECAYAKDPRIVQFKKEDQESKERAKQERQRAAKERIAEEERKKREEEDRVKREKEEEEKKAKEERDAEKAKKQEIKKALAAQRRRLKKMAEDAGWWTAENEILVQMERIERVCLLLSVDEMTDLCDRVEAMRMQNDDVNAVLDEAEDVKNRKADVRAEEKTDKENQDKKVTWTSDENTLLIKATNLYPAGTVERWKVICEYLNEHRRDKESRPKGEKEVIKQAKLVQALGQKAVENVTAAACTVPSPEVSWLADEQKRLEEALRAHPSSDPERWTKISDAVGTKTKKDCITRFKYLAELVKKNKAANA